MNTLDPLAHFSSRFSKMGRYWKVKDVVYTDFYVRIRIVYRNDPRFDDCVSTATIVRLPPTINWDEKYFNSLFNYGLLNSEYEDWEIDVHVGNKIYTNRKDQSKDDELYIDILDKRLRYLFERKHQN